MPVSVLFCEGGPSSPDARVLAKLLAGLCEVRPFGGKYGMGDKILAGREVLGQDAVFGILDGDFREWCEPVEAPTDWTIRNPATQLGWRWERKEIENYLIDPVIVTRTLASAPPDYQEMLNRAATRIAPYQAARIALTLNRPRFSPLANQFGVSCGRNHLMPATCDEASCLEEAKRVALEWRATQFVEDHAVADAFAAALPGCRPDGARPRRFLTGFAGKDLLWEMREDLTASGFGSPNVFLERILSGISATPHDIATWLPEWGRLRKLIESRF